MNQTREVLSRVKQLLEAQQNLVLVSVAGVRGSTPREAGALMMVSSDETAGTIGGGELEYQAIQQALAMLKKSQAEADHEVVERQFALGSNCGQCCGGVVKLTFETLRQTPLWLEQTLAENKPTTTVAVFGAGHVGHALVDILAKLDLQIIWIDSRKAQFQGSRNSALPDNVLVTPHPQPAAFATQLPANSLCLVMTHNHSLDFDICTQLLARPDINFCGLIGSQSKRRRFEGLLRQAGLEDYAARLTCPIGVDHIPGKTPYEIAVSVSAQILIHMTSAQADRNTDATEEKLSAAVPH